MGFVGLSSTGNCLWTVGVIICNRELPSDPVVSMMVISSDQVVSNTVNKKGKVSGGQAEKKKRKKEKKTAQKSAFEYFRPMQSWQNVYSKENLTEELIASSTKIPEYEFNDDIGARASVNRD